MPIIRAGDRQLPQRFVLSCIERSDLVPIVRSLEASFQWDDWIAGQVAEGRVIEFGPDRVKYRIMKFERSTVGPTMKAGRMQAIIKVTALLDSVASVAMQRTRPVMKKAESLAAIYRACGANVAILSDFVVDRFACQVGQIPTVAIAQAMQEEGGTLVMRATSLHFLRLEDLFKSEPVVQTDEGAASRESFDWAEAAVVPWFYSLDADGNFIYGRRTDQRSAVFIPWKSERQLRNLSTVLVRRLVLRRPIDRSISAGSVFKVNGTKMAVITAAHVFNSADGGGDGEAFTKVWLGTLNH